MTDWIPPPTFGVDPRDDTTLNKITQNLLYLYERREQVGMITVCLSEIIPEGCLKCEGQEVSRVDYPELYAHWNKTSEVTITIASPGVVSWPAHGHAEGAPIVLATTGALPTGLTQGQTYYVKNPTADNFSLSEAPGGSAINTTGTQSGTHTATMSRFGIGNGTTTFDLPDMRGLGVIGADGSEFYLGQTGGSDEVTLVDDNLPEHTHTEPNHTHNVGYFTTTVASGGNSFPSVNVGGSPTGSVTTSAASGVETGSAGSGNPISIRNPYIAVIYIVRAL